MLPENRPTILIVDDDRLVRVLATIELEEAGYRVLSACSGDEALLCLESEAPDLLFADIQMPGDVNGWRLAEIARERYPEIRVIYTTGYCDEDRHVADSKIIPKPYLTPDLLKIVEEQFGDDRKARVDRGPGSLRRLTR